MSLHKSRFAAAAAFAAALSLSATPLAAAELPLADSGHGYDANQDVTQNYRWGRHRHRDGIDAGDVIAGVLILGGIAAIASAASNNRRDRDYRDYRYDDPPYRDPDEPYRYRDYNERSSDGRGIGNAVDMCVSEVERGNERVESVDQASRTGEGWHVSGRLSGGSGFSCRIDNAGRLRDLDLADGYHEGASYEVPTQDGQYDDDVYARARATQAGRVQSQGDYGPGWENSPPLDYPAEEIDEDTDG